MLHEALVLLFRDRPELAPELLRDTLRQSVPDFDEARLAEANLSQVVPTELRADLVVLLHAGQPVLGIVVEVQLRPDENKRYVWPLYVAALRAEHCCPCCLLVVSPSRATAHWAARAIELGPAGGIVQPLVVGPETIPVVTDVTQARRMPELALLSVQAHGRTADGFHVALAAMAAAAGLDHENAMLYYALIERAVSEQVRRKLEEAMRIEGYKFKSEYANRLLSQGRQEGRQEGQEKGRMQAQAESLLRLLELRRFDVTDAQRTRILQSTDLALLQRWFDRAVTAASADEIFHG